MGISRINLGRKNNKLKIFKRSSTKLMLMTTQLDIASVKAKVNLSPYHIQTAKA